MSVMILGCDSESLDKFMKLFPGTEKNERTRSLNCVLQNPGGIMFKLSTMQSTAKTIQATTTLPPQMFKHAKNRDTICVCVYDFDSNMSSSKATELIPKSLEQSCYIFEEKYKRKFRVEAMMEGKTMAVRPPLQSLVVGFSSKGNTVMSESEFEAKLKAECSTPLYQIADSKAKKATHWLKQIDCMVLDDAASAKEKLLEKLEEKYNFTFQMQTDGTVKSPKRRRKSISKSFRSSGNGPVAASEEKGSCCLIQ